MAFHVPEKNRVAGSPGGQDGAFVIRIKGKIYKTIASSGMGWEHVSCHLVIHGHGIITPSWADMCFLKSLFWDKEDCVVQYHPPESDYVNNHPHVLHLWRPIGIDIPRPPKILV